MTQQERFVKTVHFSVVDRPPLWEFAFWNETLERWYKEGLPKALSISEFFKLDSETYFGADRKPTHFFNNLFLVPSFKEEIIEETKEYKVYIDTEGITKRVFKSHSGTSMPQWIKFPIGNRKDWENFKKRLNPDSPARYPSNWDNLKETWEQRDYPLVIYVGSLFGLLRDWIGMEKFAMMFYDSPKLVEEMMDYLVEFFIQSIHKALDEVKFDHAHFWEDMAYKSGPLISPQMVKRLMLPRYKRIINFVHSYGIDIISVDCDGNINELVPIWLEAGINGVLPCEVPADVNVVTLRKKYGKNLWMAGGIDKRILSKGKREIKEEVMQKVPYLFSTGGYIPTIDHSVPPDVPLDNYLYYLQLLKEIYGIKKEVL